MSMELLLILCVALCVFGPQKLPMLAKHIGSLCNIVLHYRQKWQNVQELMTKEIALKIREEQARKADGHYTDPGIPPSSHNIEP